VSPHRFRVLLIAIGVLSLISPAAGVGQGSAKTGAPNAELARLADEDQRDRSLDPAHFARLSRAEQDSLDRWLTARDSVRRIRVRELIGKGAARVADDYVNAATVIQHARGEGANSQAYEWAVQAMKLDSTHTQARYLVAAAWDRLQVGQGKPQWYGTSVRRRPDGFAELSPIDTTQVSDSLRQRLTGWTLAERRASIEKMNADLRASRKPSPKE